jgi:hypothetical protein
MELTERQYCLYYGAKKIELAGAFDLEWKEMARHS